ncbi:MAG: hypothetical protein J3K34DRAFT_516533 [Monoraphidium minutum]|nr:MAG: hypothetical protein J3K34DRAFT_516533 [Monoraphidium minutum]
MEGHVMPGIVKVLVEGAKNLDNLVESGAQQPYYVLSCGAQRSRSKVAAAGTPASPKWNTAHKFALSNEMIMRVTIKDEVTKGVIGEALIDLTKARATGRDESAAPLVGEGGAPRGLLSFKIKFAAAEGAAPVPSEPPPAGSPRAGAPAAAAAPAAGGRGGGELEGDVTMRSVNDKMTLAKAAMQQLQAELEEMTGGGSPGATAPRRASDASGGSPYHTPTGAAASPVAARLPPAPLGGGGDGGAAVLEDIVAQYSRTAAELAAQGEPQGRVVTSKALVEAVEALYSEKSTVEEELAAVKRAMASLTQQHYVDLRRARESAPHLSPRSAAGGLPGSPGPGVSPRGGAPPASPPHAVAVSLKPLPAGGGGRRDPEQRASLSSAGGGGGGGDAPVAAHRLEIQLHRQEQANAELVARMEAQARAEEVRLITADLDTVRGAGREAAARADAAVKAAEERAADAERRAAAAEAAAAEAVAVAAAARSGAEGAGNREAALATEAAALRAALAAARDAAAAAEGARADAPAVAPAEQGELEAELQAARDAAEREAAAAAGLRRELGEAKAELETRSGQADEVDYLQQQLRRTLRQVVELQRDLQALKAAKGGGGAAAAAAEETPGAIENEFLMQELVATKLELAELKEQQLLTHRQLRQASMRQSGSGTILE